MKTTRRQNLLAAALICASLALPLSAQEFNAKPEDVNKQERNYSPAVDQNFPTRVFFGDTHLHTSYSTDAGMVGASLDLEDAYRFARGEEVRSHTGQRANLRRPLDFLVVADHAELLGMAPFIRNDEPVLLENPISKRWYEMSKAGKGYDAFIEWLNFGSQRPFENRNMSHAAWDDILKAAERYNAPGAFTSFIGFEWTSHPSGNNLHRVVMFRDGADRAREVLPMSAYDSENPEDLWKYMASYEQNTGGRMLAIPHNGNLSNGRMFELMKFDGSPLDRAYAEMRALREPVVEVTQAKGTGEAHPFLSTEDEFARFELLDKTNLQGSAPKENAMLATEYAREALKKGLELESRLGANPFKFGMVGSSDNHTALATTEEDNWFGKAHILEPGPERYRDVLIRSQVDPSLSITAPELSAAGLAAVWARENTREAIFDALARQEVYATTGTRLLVRVFAGWDFQPDEVERPDFAAEGYRRGVPMGGDLTSAPAGRSPVFMVRALRDPDGANLDRIQIIKGWLDAQGTTHEKVHDVAVSDGRTIGPDGRCRTPVGNTVDVADASWTNTIGDALLTGYWKDPDFDASERAFYYARVIEIPTPRWIAYDAKFYNLQLPEGTQTTLQERAFTSPIWYTP